MFILLSPTHYKVYGNLLGGPLFTSNNCATVLYKFIINMLAKFRRLKMYMYVLCIYYLRDVGRKVL